MAVQSGSTSASAPQPGSSGGQLTASSAMLAGAGLISSVGAGYSYKAQGYMQQASYAIQATENMRLASLRADKDVEYASIAYERKQKQVELEALNFKIQGNTLLRSLNKANAATRARAYANGMSGSSGTALSMANANVRNTHRDMAVVELNALTSRVFGMEDATNILKAGYDQAYYTREAAIGATQSALSGGAFAAQTGGLMAGASLVQGAIKFAETAPAGYIGQKITNLFNG